MKTRKAARLGVRDETRVRTTVIKVVEFSDLMFDDKRVDEAALALALSAPDVTTLGRRNLVQRDFSDLEMDDLRRQAKSVLAILGHAVPSEAAAA